MNLTISKKLIAAFLGLTIVVLIATLGLARWSFERGFLDYVNALEQGRLERIASSLTDEYIRAGNSWSEMDDESFESIMRKLSPRRSKRDRFPPPRPRGEVDFPSEFSGKRPRPEFSRQPPGDGEGRRIPSRPSSGRPSKFGPPTALFDTEGSHIAGVPAEEIDKHFISVPVLLDDEPIGELRTAPHRRFESPQETAFSKQQWLTSIFIGVVSLLLAIGVSLWLTRMLLAPVRRLISSVGKLSNGDYSTRLNEKRGDELGQLMNDLDLLALQLEENRSSRQRWLADISHELRTPITVLTGEIETMKDGIRPLDMEQLHSLDQEVERLRNLVEDLYELSLSDIGGLRYTFGELNVGDIVQTAVTRIHKRAEDKGIMVRMADEGRAVINADPQRLQQLFANLFENSLAYTDAPGTIDILLSTNDQVATVVIEDTPPGVTEEECEKLFDPLYRQEGSRNRRHAGAGLGLAICKNIVVAHQGTIQATPSKSGGVCISINFPLAKEAGNE